MAVRTSRYGKFLGCTGYPDCKNVKRIDEVKKDIIVDGKSHKKEEEANQLKRKII
jgi:ssDNA-binding Zn-finger/Zn-ribbon topoisomerase 1